jgi:hypothetical protein
MGSRGPGPNRGYQGTAAMLGIEDIKQEKLDTE